MATVDDSAKGHTTHVEDYLFEGKSGIAKIMKSLVDLMKGIPETTAQSKIDGSLSCFWGYNKNGFFIASKSIFNKDPKVNYTEADIERNHGHAPGLVATMKECLRYLPSITATKNTNVVLQGDIMFSTKKPETKTIRGKQYFVWQPNVVVNAVEVSSDLGKQIAASKFGIAPHTVYVNGKKSGDFAQYLKKSSTVFIMPVNAPILSDYSALQKSVNEMRKSVNEVSRSGLEAISTTDVKPKALSFINYCVKNSKAVTYENFLQYCTEMFDKKIGEVKSDAAKAKYAAEQKSLISFVTENASGISSVFKTHQMIAKVKNEIIAALDKEQPILRFYKNQMGELEDSSVEGYVTINKYGTAKMVNRDIFSFRNFLQNRAGVVREEFWLDEDLRIQCTVVETKGKTAVVVPLARFNPPHVEHLNLINAVQLAARKLNATPFIFVSEKTDTIKNPLTAQERIKLLNKMAGQRIFFPAFNMLAALKTLNGKYQNIVLILGDDRVEDAKRLTVYNGKEYNFDSITVKSRHEYMNTRSNSGGDGVHASDLRKWAKEGNFDDFRRAVPRSISDAEVKDVMSKIKERLK